MTPAYILLPLALLLGGVSSQTAAGGGRQLKDVIYRLREKALEGADLKTTRDLPDYMRVSNESNGNMTIFKLPRNLDGYNLEISFNALGGVNVTHFVSAPVITVLVSDEVQKTPRIRVGEDVVIDDDIFNTIFPLDLLENFEQLQTKSTTISTSTSTTNTTTSADFTASTASTRTTTTSSNTTTVTTPKSPAVPDPPGSRACLPCLPSLLLLVSTWLLVFRG